MPEPLLKVEELCAGYGEIRVLWGVDFEVADGEITCIVGSNGAGKSTLLRTLSGEISPTSGRIRFVGKTLLDLSPGKLCRVVLHTFQKDDACSPE